MKLKNDWNINSKLEGRQLLNQNPFPENKKEQVFERLDFEVVLDKALNSSNDLGIGYLVRWEEGKFIHRFIQQYAYTKKLYSSKMSHRFRIDQTLEDAESPQFRLRYRASWEKPLSGLQVDPKEFYLKLNNEYLGVLQDSKTNMEVRGLAIIGYTIGKENRIETGGDYRMEEIFGNISHKVFLNISFYQNF
ncbi:DUF2490 domain-containing protein [Pedobacter sp. MC2016-05]|uniref:DUF2490 domain-containing protein n=1 Tax=Pedobacter sp. MC2016-05 TaxID=2994474 RepID=UPI002247F684|nr:DUF2490 domain-containing protein [Pedobacter sp. MC2016-05]MCX2473485.1 DUF2490 domain-containing protein [Pedobacter sp. MC2016-05]